MCDQHHPNQGLTKDKTPYVLEYGAPCVKCKEKPITIIIRQAAYCSDCFQAVAYHKYRVNVFKTRTGSTGTERVLVAMSTGQASRMLLYFTQLTRIQDQNRRNMDFFIPVHVVEDEGEGTSELEAFVKDMGLELIKVPLHAILNRELSRCMDLQSLGTEETRRRLAEILSSAKTSSARADLTRILRTNLLTSLAKMHECKRIYLGDTNDRIAINVMADVCAGRGAIIPWTQMPVQHFTSLELGFVRPLREAQALEVPEYLKLIGKLPSFKPQENKSTIYGLTDAFISNLAVEYTATPSIVTRTAAKVETALTPRDPQHHCSLCHGPVPLGVLICSPCQGLLKEVPLLQINELQKF